MGPARIPVEPVLALDAEGERRADRRAARGRGALRAPRRPVARRPPARGRDLTRPHPARRAADRTPRRGAAPARKVARGWRGRAYLASEEGLRALPRRDQR